MAAPRLNLLDWESFGAAPVGYDAATLFFLSLLRPGMVSKVHETFAGILESSGGIRSRPHVIGRYLKCVEYSDFIDLADHLYEHTRKLMS